MNESALDFALRATARYPPPVEGGVSFKFWIAKRSNSIPKREVRRCNSSSIQTLRCHHLGFRLAVSYFFTEGMVHDERQKANRTSVNRHSISASYAINITIFWLIIDERHKRNVSTERLQRDALCDDIKRNQDSRSLAVSGPSRPCQARSLASGGMPLRQNQMPRPWSTRRLRPLC